MADRLLVPNTVGIRHLSPAGGLHVESILDRINPTLVLLEAPAGSETVLSDLVHPETEPPVALLAFTRDQPLQHLLYPMADYSPEWVVCRWAQMHQRPLRFIDLPVEVFLALQRQRMSGEETPGHLKEDDGAQKPAVPRSLAHDALQKLGEAEGSDAETWWEKSIEHTEIAEAYVAAVGAYGSGLRQQLSAESEDALREAHMRRVIRAALAEGHAPDKVVVVCGAFHVPALTDGLTAMSDEELKKLPWVDASLSLMPYSNARLHNRSGYGAGNHAPHYFGMLYRALKSGGSARLAPRFLARVARELRRNGQAASAAQVIDAVRLAHALASLRESPVMTLRELRDAAVTCFGNGDLERVALALDSVETGQSVGKLPPGVARTALQEDFHRQVDRFGLRDFLVAEEKRIELDLREDRRAKSTETAFKDRNRSIFFHQLNACGLPFASQASSGQKLTSWKEVWGLSWTPELEVCLAELSLQGDSVVGVVSFHLSNALTQAQSCGAAAELLLTATTCEVTQALENARARIADIAAADFDLGSLSLAVQKVLETARYTGVRAIDPEPLWPLLERLFRRAVLSFPTSVHCNRDAQGLLAQAMVGLSRAAIEAPSRVPGNEWADALKVVALSDAGNAYLCGLAAALCLERNSLSESELNGVLSRRLCPSEDVDLTSEYFEGLASHNRLALLARQGVWKFMNAYVESLEGDAFLRAVVPLRRAFSSFSQGEVRRVVSSLSALWKENGRPSAAVDVESPLTHSESEALNESLKDLDF